MDPTTLSKEDLRRINFSVYTADYNSIDKTKFPSNTDRLRALQHARDAFDAANKLIDVLDEHEKNDTATMSEEAKNATRELSNYIRVNYWTSIQSVHNMKVRAGFIEATTTEAKDMKTTLRDKVNDAHEMTKLSKQAANVSKALIEAVHTKKFAHSASIRRGFSEGLTLDRLVDRYSAQKFKKKFTSLEPKKQIEVYGAIIEAAGCSNKLVETISKIEGALGRAQLMLAIGLLVWDVINADNPILTLAKGVWMNIAGTAVAVTGDLIVSTAVSQGLVAFGIAKTTALAIAFMGGLAAGIILSVVAAPLLENLFDLMVGSLSFSIPPELTTSLITVTRVPLDSPLTVELTTPLTLDLK